MSNPDSSGSGNRSPTSVLRRRRVAPKSKPKGRHISDLAPDEATLLLFRELRSANIIAAIVFGVQAIAFYVASNDTPVALECRGSTTPCAYVHRSTMVIIYVTLASTHHCYCGFLPAKYRSDIGLARNMYRWSEYCVCSSIIVALLGILVGITDVTRLIFLASLQAITIVLGALWEANSKATYLHFLGWIPFSMEWMIIMHKYLLGLSSGTLPGFTIWLIPVQFLLFISFGAVQLLEVFSVSPFTSYSIVEVTYITLSITVKSLLSCSLFFTQFFS